MAVTVQDTFTEASDTALNAHTADTGESWTHNFGAATVTAATDLVTSDAGGVFRGLLNITPADANYYCEVTGNCGGTAGTDRIGVQIRWDGVAEGSGMDAYETIQLGGGPALWRCRSYVADTETQLDSGDVPNAAATTDRVLRLEHDGTNIICTEDSVSIAGLPTANSDVTIAGDVGIYLRGNGEITLLESDAVAASGGRIMSSLVGGGGLAGEGGIAGAGGGLAG